MSQSKGFALVTGASSGIGAAYAARLAERGHDLILVARRLDRLESLADQLRGLYGRTVETVQADLANEPDVAQVENILSSHPNVQMLVNCAGLGALGPATSPAAAAVGGMLKVNVLALTQLSLAAAKRFAAAKSGTIINIGSVVAFMPVASAGGYSGSKAYVLNFSRALQAELAESNVTVQVVMPGPVRSEFFGDKPSPFPEHLFMDSEMLVDTALIALEQGEMVCFPNLQEIEAWQAVEAARGGLVKGFSQTGKPAPRYSK
ncbi:hypothetical protein SAMN05216603_12334 [Pseudomonas benzenivorans]|nr:SDR family NAD(P)-dependent oxidoreductase [Pseudomonas benzenivorans]SDI15921.1 hypothetical protein SAMN05216603_12334 [Pseudomonas benzenivorans]